MLHDLLILLFLLPMIPLPLYSSGFTGGNLTITNNLFNASFVVIRHCFLFVFAIIEAVFLKLSYLM